MLIFFLGTNDACNYGCRYRDDDELNLLGDRYEHALRSALRTLKRDYPRLIVQIALLFPLSQIYSLNLSSSHCVVMRKLFRRECTCVFRTGAAGEVARQRVDVLVAEYNRRITKVVAEFRAAAKRSDTFAVVTAPMYSDLKLGEDDGLDVSFVSKLDCFHPNEKAHALMAKSFW